MVMMLDISLSSNNITNTRASMHEFCTNLGQTHDPTTACANNTRLHVQVNQLGVLWEWQASDQTGAIDADRSLNTARRKRRSMAEWHGMA